MLTKSTIITIKFCADVFAVDTTRGVRFQIFDENGAPLKVDYTTQGLCSMDDDRLAGIHIGLTCIKDLFDKIVEHRNKQIEQIAKEIVQITGEPIKYSELPTCQGPTGMSYHLPGTEDNQLPST